MNTFEEHLFKIKGRETDMVRWVVATVIVVALIFASVPMRVQSLRAIAQITPTIENPGLEPPYMEAGAGEVTVAHGWNPWWDESSGRHRPEWKPFQDDGRWVVRQGLTAQKQFTTFSKQDGGLFQTVVASPGAWYQFTCYAYVRSSDHDSPANESPPPNGSLAVMVGLNPWGSTNALHRTTIWGRENDKGEKPWKVYNQWVPVTVIAQAWGTRIALFTRAESLYPVKHNDVLWDDCSISVYSSGSQPTPTVVPPTPVPGECPSLTEIEVAVKKIVDDREPVIWPK